MINLSMAVNWSSHEMEFSNYHNKINRRDHLKTKLHTLKNKEKTNWAFNRLVLQKLKLTH